jgi:ubiquitin carboxyl-terminal hydrolase MINDY-1/2
MSTVDNEPAKSSSDAVWRLKEICYPPGSSNIYKVETNHLEVGQELYLHYTQIVTQNRNGPCSLIALCNIMILRGDIQILPQGRTSASYEYLASLVGDYLVNSREGLSDVDLTAALAVLPSTY